MTRSLRWCGKVAAVLSAVVLAGGYVASRAVPGLLQSFQVFGGEGGGRALPAQPVDRPDAAIFGSSKSAIVSGPLLPTGGDDSPVQRRATGKSASKASAKPRPAAIIPSTKSAAIFDSSGLVVGSAPDSQAAPAPRVSVRTTSSGIMPLSMSGPMFAAPPPAVQPPPAPARQPPRQVVLSDGTVVQLPGGTTGSSVQTAAAKRTRPRPATNARRQAAPKVQQVQPQEIMAGSKSAPIMLYNGSR